MEYRKLISFGKSSFVVSMPKNWVVQNKLKKGDQVYLEENGPNLMLSTAVNNKESEEKTAIIDIDGKTIPLIVREVNSAYILNHRTIILKGKEIKNKIKELQELVQNLIALEIMEQNSESIVAKDFLNMKKVSVDELIRKMDIVTRTMLKECAKTFVEDNYKNTNERDKDVNRLYFLLYRTILYNLENSSQALKQLKLGPAGLLSSLFTGFYIEGIADEARRTARFMRLLKISQHEKKKIEEILNQINGFYNGVLKCVYDKDITNAYHYSEFKKKFNQELDKLEAANHQVEHYSSVTHRIRRLVSYIHGIGRIAYTCGNY